MDDLTKVLNALDGGDPRASEELLPLVYDELRRLAAVRLSQEVPGQTLQATALVHEVYLRLVEANGGQGWNGRGHFFAAAAEAMRRILINRARDGRRLKRGGGRRRVGLEDLAGATSADADALLDLDEALGRLAAAYPRPAELVKLRYFAGLGLDEAAAVLGISPSTADREWTFARAWLVDALEAS
jgi:RNA polymerase sigma factor (TIGR02999 family)